MSKKHKLSKVQFGIPQAMGEMLTAVRIVSGALDVFGDGGTETIILRGVIDHRCLHLIKADVYQRDIQPNAHINRIMAGLRKGTVPDIVLGMRGSRTLDKGDVYTLLDDVYVIDGLQRIEAGRRLLIEDPKAVVRIGAMVHFDTTFAWEKERFEILNTQRKSVSPNVQLRNKTDVPIVDRIYRICGDPAVTPSVPGDSDFPLCGRIAWSQPARKDALISATTLIRTVLQLHGRFGNGTRSCSKALPEAAQETAEKIGVSVFSGNMRTFFDMIEYSWGLRAISYKSEAPQVRNTFLYTLAKIFSDFSVFWRGKVLDLRADERAKLATFPINDPSIRNLCGSGGSSHALLRQLIIEHFNKGKRVRRLENDAPVSRIQFASNKGGKAHKKATL